MKILVVKYLPSGNDSNTLKLLNAFKQNLNGFHSVVELDLVKNPPKHFDELSLKAYKKRNFGGEKLSQQEADALSMSDKLTQDFMDADIIVLATPMHNFSLPGIVKVYFDAIMQSGKLFTYKNNAPVGLMGTKKFLTLYTSMGTYNSEYGYLDNLKTLLKIELDFIGIKDYEFIHASTGNKATVNIHLESASNAIKSLLTNWKL